MGRWFFGRYGNWLSDLEALMFDVPAAIRVVGYVALAGMAFAAARWVIKTIQARQENKQFKAKQKGDDEFFKDGEKWDDADPLGDDD